MSLTADEAGVLLGDELGQAVGARQQGRELGVGVGGLQLGVLRMLTSAIMFFRPTEQSLRNGESPPIPPIPKPGQSIVRQAWSVRIPRRFPGSPTAYSSPASQPLRSPFLAQ